MPTLRMIRYPARGENSKEKKKKKLKRTQKKKKKKERNGDAGEMTYFQIQER